MSEKSFVVCDVCGQVINEGDFAIAAYGMFFGSEDCEFAFEHGEYLTEDEFFEELIGRSSDLDALAIAETIPGAIAVGGIVVAMYLPLFKLIKLLSGG